MTVTIKDNDFAMRGRLDGLKQALVIAETLHSYNESEKDMLHECCYSLVEALKRAFEEAEQKLSASK